jgi:glycosyltransferase involved in cell wall biosynthesis
MRVAHVVQDLDPAMGGLATVPVNMVRALAQAGVDVEIWTGSWHDAPLPKAEELKGSITLIEKKASRGFLDSGFFNAFRDDLKRVDVVHTHSFWRPYCARFAAECVRIGKPIVHTMHGMLMEHPMRQKTAKKKLWLGLMGARHLRRLSAVQMLNREETVQSLRASGCDFRFFELPNGVDPAEFAALPPRGKYRITEPSLADTFMILSLGRLHEMKGPDLLLQAFLEAAATHRDISLVMAGPDEGMRGMLEGMMKGRPGAERVRMPGLVRGEQRLALMADADVFAQTSRHETMSMSIIEAAYAQKPLVITERCHFPEMGESGAGVVVPTSGEGIRQGIERMIADRARLAEMGAKGRRLIEERFTIQRVTQELMRVYEGLMREKGGERFPWARATVG